VVSLYTFSGTSFNKTFNVPTTLNVPSSQSVVEGDYYVYLTTSTDTTILAVEPFTVITQATITLDPDTGATGDSISMDGSDFNASTAVYIYFSSDSASVGEAIDSDVTIYELVKTVSSATVGSDGIFTNQSFNVPSRLTDGDTTENVTNGNYYVYATNDSTSGTILAVADFAVESSADITLAPDDGPIGATIDIDGDGFAASTAVYIYFSSDSASVGEAIDSDVTIYELLKTVSNTTVGSDGIFSTTFPVPSALTDGDTTENVTNGSYYVYAAYSNDTILARALFSVTSAAGTITLNPKEGAVGDTVAIQGTGFSASTNISARFDGTAVAIQSGTSTTSSSGSFSISIKIPDSSAGTHTVSVVVSSQEVKADFKVKPKAVMTPTSGAADASVSVVGTGYAAAKQVTIYFNNTSLTSKLTDAKGGVTTSFTVPKLAAGSYNVEFQDADGNLSSLRFTITGVTPPPPTTPPTTTPAPAPAPAVTVNMNPTKGFIGSEVVVGGAGFKDGATISVKWDDKEMASVKGGTQGIFIATFNVPAGKSGDHAVTVTDGTKTEKLTFKVEATVPDIPAPLAPAMGVEVEKTLTFDWKDVTSDNTPVTYVLQVATSQEFTPASLVIEKKGLSKSEYAPTKEEAAKLAGRDTPYYWRIRAVDAGENESNWTGVGQFYVPKPFNLPNWAKWLAIVVGALVLLFIGYWVGRRSAYSY
jgi:hypothetical protein